MKYYKDIFISIIIFTLIFYDAHSESLKNEVYNKLLNIYGNVQSVSLDFILINNDFSGNLIAQKGNKYKMNLGDRIIVCNGKTIWNYSKKSNKVVISNYENDNDNISLEEIFFSFIKNFKPISVIKKNNGYLINLKSKDSSNYMPDISEVNLRITKKYKISSIQVVENSDTLTWQIKNLSLMEKFDDKIFEFKSPDKCTAIDLR